MGHAVACLLLIWLPSDDNAFKYVLDSLTLWHFLICFIVFCLRSCSCITLTFMHVCSLSSPSNTFFFPRQTGLMKTFFFNMPINLALSSHQLPISFPSALNSTPNSCNDEWTVLLPDGCWDRQLTILLPDACWDR